MVKKGEEEDEWQLGSGLLDDANGWIANPRFQTASHAYTQRVGAEQVMFVFDLVDANGNILTMPEYPPSYSVGSGWKVVDNGKRIENPAISRINKNSNYGRMIDRVTSVLSVDMRSRGKSPKEAKIWEGLGFHWKREETPTIKGEEYKEHLMPTQFLGELELKPAIEIPAELEKSLEDMAKVAKSIKQFQEASLTNPDVTSNPKLIAHIMDNTEAGFFARHRK